MCNATVELAKYKLEQNRRSYKIYKELIEIQRQLVEEFRGTEFALICLNSIATLVDMIDDLKTEAEEYIEEISQDLKTDTEKFEETIRGHGKTIDRGMN